MASLKDEDFLRLLAQLEMSHESNSDDDGSTAFCHSAKGSDKTAPPAGKQSRIYKPPSTQKHRSFKFYQFAEYYNQLRSSSVRYKYQRKYEHFWLYAEDPDQPGPSSVKNRGQQETSFEDDDDEVFWSPVSPGPSLMRYRSQEESSSEYNDEDSWSSGQSGPSSVRHRYREKSSSENSGEDSWLPTEDPDQPGPSPVTYVSILTFLAQRANPFVNSRERINSFTKFKCLPPISNQIPEIIILLGWVAEHCTQTGRIWARKTNLKKYI